MVTAGNNLSHQEKEELRKKETPAFEVGEKLTEKAAEKIKEQVFESQGEIKKEEPRPEISQPPSQIGAKIIKSQTLKDIENILEEDLEEIYFNLPPQKQTEFGQKGEETASKIEMILKRVKIKVSQILNLIREWLKLIPGVNKFFLEQEAKIKTDKILQIAHKDEKTKEKSLKVKS